MILKTLQLKKSLPHQSQPFQVTDLRLEPFFVVFCFRHRLGPHRHELRQVERRARLQKILSEEPTHSIAMNAELVGVVGTKINVENLFDDEIWLQLLEGFHGVALDDVVIGPD